MTGFAITMACKLTVPGIGNVPLAAVQIFGWDSTVLFERRVPELAELVQRLPEILLGDAGAVFRFWHQLERGYLEDLGDRVDPPKRELRLIAFNLRIRGLGDIEFPGHILLAVVFYQPLYSYFFADAHVLIDFTGYPISKSTNLQDTVLAIGW